MTNFCVVLFFAAMVVIKDVGGSSTATQVRVPRTLHQRRCQKYGICGGGFQGSYGGYSGYSQGQQGYGQPPINIAISQSQSSANEGGGGHANGYYPNNYQYNGHPNYSGYNNNNNGYNGYQGFNRNPGYYGNGQGSYNNQFNGNYYGGPNNGGGYGFQRPYGQFYDDNEGSEDGNGYGNEDDSRDKK